MIAIATITPKAIFTTSLIILVSFVLKNKDDFVSLSEYFCKNKGFFTRLIFPANIEYLNFLLTYLVVQKFELF